MANKKEKGSVFAVVQQIGKSFFLPVSVLPIAGLLLGLGSSFTNEKTIAAYHLQGILGEGTILNGLLTIMSQVGNTIFGNLPLIFALAVALGMAKNEKAVAVLSAGISFFVMNSTINAMLKLTEASCRMEVMPRMFWKVPLPMSAELIPFRWAYLPVLLSVL